MRTGVPVYAAAVLLGLVAALLVLPGAALRGGGPGWAAPGPERAQALTGQLAYQADAWRHPPLDTARLFVPHRVSLAAVDGNVLLAMLAKAWVRASGAGAVNWLGWFLGACWLLQPVGAVYAARGLRLGWLAALTAGVLACAWPALLVRTGQIDLCAHVLLLVALGLAFRGGEGPGRWIAAAPLLLVAILVQPSLFWLCAAVLASVPVQAAVRRRPRWLRDAALHAGSVVAAVGVFVLLGGSLAGLLGGGGFGGGGLAASTDLSGPVWPDGSGVFGLALRGLGVTGMGATGGQLGGQLGGQPGGQAGGQPGGQAGEAAWLGAGTLLLLAAGLVAAGVRRAWPRPGIGLVVVLAGLAVLSTGGQVYAGPLKLVDLGRDWERVFGGFGLSGVQWGRAFWPVGYALMLAGVAAVARLGGAARGRVSRVVGPALLVVAAGVQVVDAGPLLQRARSTWLDAAGTGMPAVPSGIGMQAVPSGTGAPAFPSGTGAPAVPSGTGAPAVPSGTGAPAVPSGTTLFSVAPYPACSTDAATRAAGPLMLLDAVRHGAETGDVGLARLPAWFSCEAVMADALELPLLPHEVRAFSGRQIQAPLRPVLLGEGAVCRHIPAGTPGVPGTAGGGPDVVLCGRGVGAFAGETLPAGVRPAAVALPFETGAETLGSVLGYGWRLGVGLGLGVGVGGGVGGTGSGGAWSEGPQSSLVIPVAPGHRLELRVHASGVGASPGSGRVVAVMAGRVPLGQFTLPDGIATEVTVAIPASTIESGFLRVAFSVTRPVDPAMRGIAAPVRGAAILLRGVSLRVEEPALP